MAINLALIKPAILKAKDIATIADVEAVKEYADTTVIDGSRITTGTIDADKINTVGLVVQNVSPGGINPTFEIKANGTAGPNANANIYGARISSGYIFSQGGMYIDLVNGEYTYSMSLYLGKDNSNNNVFHITASTRPVSGLKEGVQADTLFHSNAPLITCKKWDMVSISGSGNDYYVQFPLSAISYILSVTPRLTYDIVINGKIHRYLKWANVPDGRLWWYTAVSGAYSQFPTLNHTFIRIGNNNNAITSASIIVYNISIDGTIHNPIQNPSTIVISNTELSIGGTDITELNFLTSPKVNDTDYYFIDDYNNTRQILNSSSTSTGIVINTVPSIKISNGDKCIINASSGFNGIHGSHIRTVNWAYVNSRIHKFTN